MFDLSTKVNTKPDFIEASINYGTVIGGLRVSTGEHDKSMRRVAEGGGVR